MKGALGATIPFARVHVVCGSLIIFALLCLWMLKCDLPKGHLDSPSPGPQPIVVKNFSTRNVMSFAYFRRFCFNGKIPRSLNDLLVLMNFLRSRKQLVCQQQHELLHSIYRVRKRMADVMPPAVRSNRVHREHQTLLFVDNLYSLEGVVFNLARVDTPSLWGNVSEHVRKTVEDAQKNCDFCSVKKTTATDTFGRMESRHAVIVSNAFKIQKYHGLAIFKKHHPLEWNQEQFIDCMALIMKWFKHVQEVSPDDVYKMIYWDLLLKSGVSQMHPHMHLVLGNRQYFAKYNEWNHAAQKFAEQNNGLNYWSSLIQVYTTLGLTATFGNATVLASLTPKRDYEVIVISERPCLDFFRLVFFTLRSFIDDLGEPSVCMGYAFPKSIADKSKGAKELPMLFRLVSRGDPVSLQSDISSFDLYGTPNINRDPYKVILAIRETVKRTKGEIFKYANWEN